ncbi:MAG: hypothetical protein ISS82_06305, partial [Nanoarchaeota archaeon]|nr:hypothetical protein [Nanoarchaeota archaeon]
KDSKPSGLDYNKIHKIKDIYSASETSSYFGAMEQRKGLQQEKVAQYLGTIGGMMKNLFQMIRELRMIDERIQHYVDSEKGDESAEVALKSIWVDMVEGGINNPNSVTALSLKVGFVILPDLFYSIHPKKSIDVDKEVKKLEEKGINRKVREILSRKLKQYLLWKEKTNIELKQRKNFLLKYLRQHYNTIKLYMNWIRPYLKNIRRLQMADLTERPEVVSAFETSVIELELLGENTREGKFYHPCILVKFDYVAIPQMAYQNEYQRGAIHAGLTKIRMEAYALTDKQIRDYQKKQDEEDMELLSNLTASMETLKDDLHRYLEEGGEVFKKEEEKEKKNIIKEFLTPFTSIFKGFKDVFGKKTQKEEVAKSFSTEQDKKKIESIVLINLYTMYDVFKKAHKMITW